MSIDLSDFEPISKFRFKGCRGVSPRVTFRLHKKQHDYAAITIYLPAQIVPQNFLLPLVESRQTTGGVVIKEVMAQMKPVVITRSKSDQFVFLLSAQEFETEENAHYLYQSSRIQGTSSKPCYRIIMSVKLTDVLIPMLNQSPSPYNWRVDGDHMILTPIKDLLRGFEENTDV